MTKQKFKIDWSKALEKIREQQNDRKSGNLFKDERFYYPEFNENGIAQAIIRFLPSPDTDIPFVSVYTHSFKGPGGWYIENCPTTLKKECPVCKANTAIWDSDPDTARSRKRKQNFFSNILVIKDPLHPENEGKVFIYKYGKKVHEKIMEKIQPVEGSIEEPVMVFDYYDGADFKLIIKKIKVGNITMPNYDSCQFSKPSVIGSDEEIERINKSLYGISDFISESAFKKYEELENKFDKVIGSSLISPSKPIQDVNVSKPETKIADDDIFSGSDADFFNELQSEESEENS